MPYALTVILRRRSRSSTLDIRFIDGGSGYCRWCRANARLDLCLYSIHPVAAVGTDLLYAAVTKSVGTLMTWL